MFFVNIESNEYLTNIREALEVFKPCESKNCGCHAETIVKSLYPFRNGITKDMIDSVRHYATKYQVIDNKVYRDPSCLFPSRCAGIEYFLKANIQKIPDLEMIVNCRDWPQINIQHVSDMHLLFSLYILTISLETFFVLLKIACIRSSVFIQSNK